MKPNYLPLFTGALLLLLSLQSYAQTETEPNDNLATADTTSEGIAISGDVGTGDLSDYFYTVLSDDGTIKLKFNYAGTDPGNGTDILVQVLDQDGSLIANFSRNNLVNGTNFNDSIMVYCRAADTVYFRFFVFGGSGSMDYSMVYTLDVPGPNDAEPNNTLALANQVNESIKYFGRLGYTSNTSDLNDHYYTILPDDGTLKLKFNYTAGTPANTTDVLIQVLNKNGALIGTFSESNLIADSTYKDSIVVYCRAADTVYFRFFVFGGSGCMEYDFEYEQIVAGPNDPEPNDDFATSSEVLEAQNYQGRLGYTSIAQDLEDNYYTILPDDGTLTLKFNYTAITLGHTTDMQVQVFNKNGGQIGVFSRSNLERDSTFSDSIVVYCRAADTVYFRFYNYSGSGCYVYDFEYSQFVPGPNDPEPNDDFLTSSEVLEAQNYQGRLGYTSIAQDLEDNYYTILPDDGTLTLKFNYTAITLGHTTDMQVQVFNKNGGQIGVFSRSNLERDSTFSDSIVVYCRAADTVYFRFYNYSGSGCYVYDFEYSQSVPGPNDPEPNDGFATSSEVLEAQNYQGRLGYTSIAQDLEDNYYTILPDDGTLTLKFNYTAITLGHTTDMQVQVFNKNGGQIGVFSRSNLERDSTFSDSIVVYCRAADTVYFRFYNYSGSGCYVYDFDYDLAPSGIKDTEPNNTLAQAPLTDITNISNGTVGHTSIATDLNDYYKFYNSGYSEIKWVIDYNNTTGANTADINFVLLNSSGSAISGKTIAKSNILVGQASDSISLSCYPLDTFYVRINSSNGCLGYTFHFDLVSGTFYADADGDNFGDPDSSTYSCVGPPPGFIADNSDCNDADSTINPNAIEICDGVDNNCDGNIDEGIFTTTNSVAAICQGDSLLIGGIYRTMTGTYVDTTIIVDGCDSISTVALTVNPTDTTGSTTTTTDPGMAGVFTTVLTNQFGCDSVVIDTVVLVSPPCPNTDSTTVNQITCDSTQAGTTVATVVGSDGCDSVVTTVTVFDPGATTMLPPVSICNGDSSMILGVFQSVAGVYRDTLPNVNGCDSILEQELIVNPTYNTSLPSMSICSGDSLLIFGTYQSTAGTYSFTYQTADGCDSVVSKQLMVDSLINTSENQSICDGDSLLIFGTYQNMAGAYTDTNQSASGCDSIHTVNLMVRPNATGTAMAMICDGDSILLGGAYQTAPGIYMDTFQSANGCDSVVSTTLSVKPNVATTVADSICPGDSALVGGAYQTTAGTYTDVFTAANGCDSTLITTLYVKDSVDCPSDTVVTGPLVCVSDSSWRLSTVVTTATSNLYPWPGVMTVPAVATFSLPVDVGQPYPWVHLLTVPGSEVITSGSGITYYRKTFELADPTGIEARFRMFVDDDMQIFINGQWIAIEVDLGPANYRTANHDLLFNGDGTYANGYLGGDPFDGVTTADLDTVFKTGNNELVLAIRNRTSKPDIGGFSFRMDLDKGALPLVPKSTILPQDVSGFGISVYPNPANDFITVSLLKPVEGATVSVYDFSGKHIAGKPMMNVCQINLADYAQGVYLVKVTAGDKTFVQKIVKQ